MKTRSGNIASVVSTFLLAVVAGCSDDAYQGPLANSRAAMDIRAAIASGEEGDGGATAVVSTGTGWATLRGRFAYDGTPPQMPPYDVTKDLAICASGGQPPLQQTLVVDSATGGIKNIAVYLRRASRVHESAQPPSEPVEFDQKTCVFLSHVLPVHVGQTVELINSDPVGHNTNISGKNTFNQTIPAEQSITFVPHSEEAIPAKVVCSIHPWMVSYMLPRENGYFAVTAEDGSFELANLPAGEELEIQVWHESAASASGGLVLTSPAAEELGWTNKGRFSIRLEEGATEELELTVPASAFRG